MDGNALNENVSEYGAVQDDLSPMHRKKTLRAMKAVRSAKRLTFSPSEANPGETLFVYVPKLGVGEVITPNTLAPVFDIHLSGGHANNFLVQNVSRVLVSKLAVKFGTEILEETVSYDLYKTIQDLFLPGEKRDNMVPEGIQSEDLCKIRSKSGDKKTSSIHAEKKLNKVYGGKYRINLDHQILTEHGVFYPQALYGGLVFEVTLAPEGEVVKGSDTTKLKYKLKNIQLEYEMIKSKKLAEEAARVYESGREFAYDHVARGKVVTFDRANDTIINIKVNTQRRSMKGILLLFVEPYAAGTRDSEKFIFPDLKKISVSVRGSPHMLYSTRIQSRERSKPILHERKTQTSVYESVEVLHRQ